MSLPSKKELSNSVSHRALNMRDKRRHAASKIRSVFLPYHPAFPAEYHNETVSVDVFLKLLLIAEKMMSDGQKLQKAALKLTAGIEIPVHIVKKDGSCFCPPMLPSQENAETMQAQADIFLKLGHTQKNFLRHTWIEKMKSFM